jgi:DNA sulfur modification protein DndE
MKVTKLRFSKQASNMMRFLAGKTGLTPNLLCRIGFCLSLSEQRVPNPDEYPEDDREFNRYTLLGEHDALFVALLNERCKRDGIDPSKVEQQFRAHMNRGVMLLQLRVRNIGDLADLVSETQSRFQNSSEQHEKK